LPDSGGSPWWPWLVEFRFKTPPGTHISPSTSSVQSNRASWASQTQKSVTLRPQPEGETTKSMTDIWWRWIKKTYTLCYSQWTTLVCKPKLRTRVRQKAVTLRAV
jgi:hypothetical protein